MWSFDWQTRVARGLKSIIWHVIIKFFTVFIKVAVISKLPACQILITHICVSRIHKGPPPVGQTFLFFCSLWNFLNVIFLRGQSWRESNQRLHWSCFCVCCWSHSWRTLHLLLLLCCWVVLDIRVGGQKLMFDFAQVWAPGWNHRHTELLKIAAAQEAVQRCTRTWPLNWIQVLILFSLH